MRVLNGTITWFITSIFAIYTFSLGTASAVIAGALKSSLSLTAVQTSYTIEAFIIGYACMQLPAGYLLDRYKARYVVSGGILILAVGNYLTYMTHSFDAFIVTNFIQGLGAAFSFLSVTVLIARNFSRKMFPILLGITQMLACILSGFIHTQLAHYLKQYTWNTVYLYLGIFCTLLFITSLAFIRSAPNLQTPKAFSLLTSLKKVCSNKQIWLCMIGGATSFGSLLAYASFWYLSVQNYHHTSNRDAMTISTMIFIGIGIGAPVLGWLSNLFKSRQLILHVSLVTGVMLLLLSIYLPKFNMDSLIVIKTVSFMLGFLLSGSTLFFTVTSELANDKIRGVAMSLINTAVFILNSLMLIAPYILTTSQTFFTHLWVLPFCILISVNLLYFIKETYSSPPINHRRVIE